MSDQEPVVPQPGRARVNSHRSMAGHAIQPVARHDMSNSNPGHRTPIKKISAPLQSSATQTRPRQRSNFVRPSHLISDVAPVKPKPQITSSHLTIIKPQPIPVPAGQRLQRSQVLQRQFVQPVNLMLPVAPNNKRKLRKPTMQIVLISMACLVFMFGIAVSIQTLRTNRHATAQVTALAEKAQQSSNNDSSLPSTKKPSSDDIKNYKVAPDLARYIKIPSINVYARVMQVGETSKGAIDVPGNVHDAAWYNASAKPGQVGATVLDGHVSGWGTAGVFHDIKKLSAGDTVQIVKGDNTILTYKVIKTVVYDAKKVDMQAVVNPVSKGKSGLNLITCDGHVKAGTSEYTQRVVVFTEKV